MKQKLDVSKFSAVRDPKKLRLSTLDHICVRIIKENNNPLGISFKPHELTSI